MRVTNNMIMRNSSYNINGVKGIVNQKMNQMTTQKKITKPSDDPVVAIRSLRLSTSLSRVDQYYEKNIPDAKSWLEVTETALGNIKSLMTDIRTQCVNGATDTLTQDDRNTILAQLKALQSQVFAEGNADYAGRTVFTGFRTNKELVFSVDEKATKYEIQQDISWEKVESFRYYDGDVKVPSTLAEVANLANKDNIVQRNYDRVVLGYKEVDGLTPAGSFEYSYMNAGTLTTKQVTVKEFDDEEAWAADAGAYKGKQVPDNEAVFIKSTGQLILSEQVSSDIKANKATISLEYTKQGFKTGDLRPEYYYNCKDVTSPNAANHITYEKFNSDGEEIGYDINYTVSMNQEITVNLEASDAFNGDIQRDVDDMIYAIERAIQAHDKLESIKAMKSQPQYAGTEEQKQLQQWQDAAQKEADFFDDHVQKLYSRQIGKTDSYLENVNLAIAKVGCTVDQILLTETRMNNQQETIMDLQSQNDDLELSDIIIKYTASYNAYQSSLQAAGKLSGMTLLNYL